MVTTAVKTRFNKNSFEYSAWGNNDLICGIDEVGRGCLAGPVVVAAVVLRPHKLSRHLRDSKIMTPEEREKAYTWIIKNSWHSIALMHHLAIDKYNIYHATLKSMKRAYMQLAPQLPQQPSAILVDAMPLQLTHTAYDHIQVLHFPFAESKSSSIAAASIVAKVTRDALIATVFETNFPDYHLKSHKGYSTPAHKKAILTLGASIIHRVNFLNSVYKQIENKSDEICQNSELFPVNSNQTETSELL